MRLIGRVSVVFAFLAVVYFGVPSEAGPAARQLEGKGSLRLSLNDVIIQFRFLLKGFTLDDVLSGRFSARSFNGTWISGIFTSNFIS